MRKHFKFNSLGIKQNFLGLDSKYSSFEDSKIVILSCPFEKTTSYGKGTSKGPKAILKASHYVEFFDEEVVSEICFDKGICTLKPLDFKNLKNKDALDYIYSNAKQLIDEEKFVVTLGGEHSISTALIKAHFDSYKDLSILQFDAHSDLRAEYEGSIYSHASFTARVLEFTNDIVQLGIRAQSFEEHELIKHKNIKTFYAYRIREEGFYDSLNEKILNQLKTNVYITFDVDFFDPSIMPSTGTPEPGGFYWDETLRLLKKIAKNSNLVGFDVVELAPKSDMHFPDFLTAKLVYKILTYKFS
jgi:agmatinase